MREQFYIDCERRKQARREWEEMDKVPPVPMDERHESVFEPRDFPDREPLQITRRRTREQVRRLIED